MDFPVGGHIEKTGGILHSNLSDKIFIEGYILRVNLHPRRPAHGIALCWCEVFEVCLFCGGV